MAAVRAAVAASLSVVACGLAACGGGGDGNGGGPATVRVEDTAGVPSAFLQYGVEEGFFKKRQLDVEVKPTQGGATTVPAVVSGNADIGGSNLVSVLLAHEEGLPLKIVAPGTFVQTDAKQDFSAILVTKDSDIRTPQDLEGKTMAVNTLKNVAEMTIKASLGKQGVDVEKVKFTEIDFPDMIGALEQGRVDAAFEIEPFLTLGLQSGDRVIDRPYVGTKPGLQIGCYFAIDEYLNENRDVVERFHDGVAETAAAIAKHPDAFRAFLPEAAKIPPPVAKAAALPAWKSNSDPASLDLIAGLMQRFGISEGKPDVSGVVDE